MDLEYYGKIIEYGDVISLSFTEHEPAGFICSTRWLLNVL